MLAQTTQIPELTSEQAALMGGTFLMFGVIGLVFLVLTFVAMWKVFTKAGEKGWKCLIPIYNTIILLKIVGREWWWILLMLIPVVNVVIWVIVMYDLSKSFGHGVGFTFGLILLSFVFLLILGLGEDRYLGPGSQMAEGGGSMPPPAPAA